MSEHSGFFRGFSDRMNKHIMDGPIGDLDRAYRRSIGLEETVSEAKGVARSLPPGESKKILDAINALDEKAGRSDTKASVYFWVGLGVGLAGFALGLIGLFT